VKSRESRIPGKEMVGYKMLENRTTIARERALRELGVPKRLSVLVEKSDSGESIHAKLGQATLPDGKRLVIRDGAAYAGQTHEVVILSATIMSSGDCHLSARIPSKTRYDFKSWVDAEIAGREQYLHQEFNDYYQALAHTLRDLMGLKGDVPRDDLQGLLESTISSLKRISHPFSGWLESTLTQGKLERAGLGPKIARLMDRILEANQESKDAHKEMLYTLFEVVHGYSNAKFTSDCLLAAGFDDTAEPDISDYYDFY
jgi:hypothetical protein